MMVALRDQYSRTLKIPGIPTLTGIVLLTHALSLLYAVAIPLPAQGTWFSAGLLMPKSPRETNKQEYKIKLKKV